MLFVMAELIWFAIRVPPQKEFLAKKILGENGVTVFLPTEHRIARQTRLSKRKKTYPHPLLVGYLFVGFQGAPRWNLVFRFPRLVQYALGDKGQPIQISSALIDYLKDKSSQSEHESKQPKPMRHPLTVGTEAKLRVGPFDHFIATISRIIGDKAEVRFRIFGATRTSVVSLDRLEVL